MAAAQMILFVTVAGELRAGYDPQRNWISQLSLGPGGWLAAVNLAACGAWLILGGAGLGSRLVGLCGGCLVVLAVVPIDPGLGYPPGVPAVHTVAGIIHQVVALGLGVAGTVAAALLGRRAGGVLPLTGLVVAAVMAVSFVGAAVLVKLDEAGVWPGTPSGLLERVALFTGLIWIGVLAMASGPGRRTGRRRSRRPDRPDRAAIGCR